MTDLSVRERRAICQATVRAKATIFRRSAATTTHGVQTRFETTRNPLLTVVVFKWDGSPGLVGIETLHLCKFVQSGGTKILFVNDTILADDKGLHARNPVFGRCSNQRKPANHDPLHDIIHLSHRRGGS